MKWLKAVRDKKGVSPVIGVILMVAITVILAAVIASFVFGMGSKVKSAPNAQLVLSDHEDKIDDNTGGDKILYISHYSGDTLKCEELKIIVFDKTNGQKDVLTWNQTANQFQGTNLIVNVTAGTDGNNGKYYYVAHSGVIEVGDTVVLYEKNGADFLNAGNVPATIEVQIVHIPTNSIIFSGEQLVQ